MNVAYKNISERKNKVAKLKLIKKMEKNIGQEFCIRYNQTSKDIKSDEPLTKIKTVLNFYLS